MKPKPCPELLAFGAFYRCNEPEGIQIVFRRDASNTDTFDELHHTSSELIGDMLRDDTLTEEEVVAQLKMFIRQYKVERELCLTLGDCNETPSMVSLAILIIGNTAWLYYKNKLPDDDNNGMLYATFL